MLRCAYGYGLELAEIGTAYPSLMSETDALRRRAGEKLVWEMEIWFRNGGPSIDMCQHITAPQVTKSTAASTLVLNRYVDEVYACFRGYHEGIERKVRRNMEVEYVTFDPGILGVDIKALMERMAEETLEYRDSAHGHLNNARSRKLDYMKNRYSAWDWD
ncbi:hypothetical protein [Pseudooceanicola sp. LIPI14-2-Ac024]|uniref:hypothetical protein n=1 Tax=Pseudooceanicola sp. LIPI14-2-Ac024 TaxID=3344875 RepID=UPI0035CEE385